MGHKRTKQRKTDEQKLDDYIPIERKKFSLDFLNEFQRSIWPKLDKNDIIFLLGGAGTGKSFLASSYAIFSLIDKRTSKIVVTRPIVEAGEKLGFLPGTFEEKVHPYMLPLYDALDDICGEDAQQRAFVDAHLEVAPVAYLRGRTLKNSVCILDEAQNCTYTQLKLFLTRIGNGSKLIITGDPQQSDLGTNIALLDVVTRLKNVTNIGIINIANEHIVRHPLIAEIAMRL
jgi:phosphate starvation-inducible PhoH-like protein